MLRQQVPLEYSEFWAQCDDMQEAELVDRVQPSYPRGGRTNHEEGRSCCRCMRMGLALTRMLSQDGFQRILVRPEDEIQAREIVREIESGTPPM